MNTAKTLDDRLDKLVHEIKEIKKELIADRSCGLALCGRGLPPGYNLVKRYPPNGMRFQRTEKFPASGRNPGERTDR